MSLFPAYGGGAGGGGGELHLLEEDSRESSSSATERRLLASDEEEPVADDATGTSGANDATPAIPADCYRDARRDPGNLRVSTLYYPGRPDYTARGAEAALGAVARRSRRQRRPRAARYYEAAPVDTRLSSDAVEAEGRALRAALTAAPRDETLALEYVRWSRSARGADGALQAAREAVVVCPTRRVRDALQRARAAALPPAAALGELRAELAAAAGGARLEAWERVVEAAGPAHAVALGGAALDAGPPAWYPRVLLAVGRSLRAAGLWERLVLLIELAASMNFPPGAGFPPSPPSAEDEAARERDLAAKEDKACGSGLPRGTVWARVERLRAEARWRAGAGGAEDPQRRPGAPELAPCLRAAPPDAAPALLVVLLRLARVPPLPASDAVWRALPEEPESGEALAALLRAGRRLPPAQEARPPPGAEPALRATLATLLDPPHYFSDSTGFLSWVSALWEAACAWAAPDEARAALVAWRLRWLHALALLAPAAEARRLRGEARGAVRRWAARDARAHALLARLEAVAAGGAEGERAARRAARVALAARAPAHHALFAARVAAELGGRREARALHALVAACLRRALPEDAALDAPPAPSDLAAALEEAARRCAEYEREWEEAGEGEGEEQEDEVAALLPSAAGEWAAARVALAGPAERARLERAVAVEARGARGARRRRYLEHAACALAVHAAAEGRLAPVAASMLPAFPENALLALACAGAPLWARPALWAWPDSHAAALARATPALLRGVEGAGAEAAARAASRAGAGGCGGAALAGVALAAAARGARGAEATALAAVARRPHHKWTAVRAAAAAPRLATSLADALLERDLRAHALIDELDRPDS